MTEFLFNNSQYRTDLINSLLTGKLKIDNHVCDCLYNVKFSANGTPKIVEPNINAKGQSLPCSYQTTLLNLGYNSKYLGGGAYGNAYKICANKDCSLDYAIKVIYYDIYHKRNYGSIDNPNRPENIEVRLLKLLNQRILYPNLSPHITLYIQDFRCKGIPIVDPKFVLSKHQDLDDIDPKHSLILISELAKYGSLHGFIVNQIKTQTVTEELLSNLVFQYVYTMAQIQKTMPNFRHNDCHAGNMLVQQDSKYNEVSEQYYIYHYGQKFFRLPLIGQQLKLWDFDFANIKGEVDNLKIETFDPEEFGYRPDKNHYYDLHILVNDLLMHKDPDSKYDADYLPAISSNSSLMTFLKEIVPVKYYGQTSPNTYYGRLIPNIEYTTPDQLLSQGGYLSKHYETTLDQINLDHVIDVFGMDRDQFEKLVKVANTETVQVPELENKYIRSPSRLVGSPQPMIAPPSEIPISQSICELPKQQKVYPNGKCPQPKAHNSPQLKPCPSQSRFCYRCVSDASLCTHGKAVRKKGLSFSYKVP